MSDDTIIPPHQPQGPFSVLTIPRTGHFVEFDGGRFAEIRADGHSVLFADVVLETTQLNGVVYFSLGAQYTDAANPGAVEVVTRVRMSVVAAQHLRDSLDLNIKAALDALKPKGNPSAN